MRRPSSQNGWFLAAWVALLVMMPIAAKAQIETGTIVGVITDETGGALPGVTVTVRNLATGQVRTVTTNELGRYQAVALQPSRYSVTAELQGFSTVVRPEITVNVGASVDIPISMKVGGVAETVTVTGEAALVQSQRTELSRVVTQQAMETLPSKQRAYLDFTLLMPATVENVSQVQGTGAVIGGTRSSQGTLLVDGFYNLDEGFAMPKQQQSQDAIQEFQVISFGGSAEYGRAIGGVINAVTKSGGNEVRGSGYGFFRNTSLNAQDWGEKARGTPKTDYNRQLFGGTVGGPIKRNKSFFFASYEYLDESWPFDNGIKMSDALAIGLPKEDAGTVPRFYNKHFVMGKVDHNISDTHQLQAQFSWNRYIDQQMCCLAALSTRSAPYALHPTDFLYMVKWTSIPAGGKMLHEVKGSYFPRQYGAWGLELGGPPLVADGQINRRPSTNASPPRVSISSVATFGSASLDNWIETYPAQVLYTASRFTQKHSVKFGADYMYAYYDYSQYHPHRGSYTFASLANFLIGRYNTYTQSFGDTWNPRTHQYLSGFVQDSWTPSNRFTINYGLRYDLELNPKQVKSGVPYGNDYNNFGPRFAVSYGLTDSGKTFLKLTSGVYYDRIWNNATNNLYSLKDHLLRKSYTWNFTTPGAPVYPNVFTSEPANLPASILNVILMPLKVNIPTNAQAVGTIEHQVSSNMSVSSSVVYTRTWYRDISWDTNLVFNDTTQRWVRPDPAYRAISQTLYIAPAEYVGGIVEVTRRGTTYGYQGNITVARARQAFSPPNQQFGVVTDVPSIEQVLEWGPNSDTPTVRGVVSGWYNVSRNIQLSGAFTARSGRAYGASAAGLDLDGDGNFGDRTPGTTPNQFRFGNTVTIDGRFVWVVPLANQRKLQFYVEGFNLANRINVRTVQTDMGRDKSIPKAIFGTPLSYFAPREVQLGARFQF